MKQTLQSASLSGLYTRFDILDTVTGDVRTITQAPNALTEEGLIHFGSDTPKWHQFNRCLLSRTPLQVTDVGWGDIIPANSNPSDPKCVNFEASEINESYHGDITKDDDGIFLYFQATKTWTFRQGIVGTFETVLSGHMESTTDVPVGGGPIYDNSALTEPCPVTGDSVYDNWKIFPVSVALLVDDATLTLRATDILTVTHEMRINLPKYQPTIVLDDITIGSQMYTFNARPYLPAYEALLPINTPITRMMYCDSSALTGGLVSGIRQTITDGDFDVIGTPFVTGDGDYTKSEQVKYTIDEVVYTEAAVRHTITIMPDEGQGKIGYLLLNGCGSWYEVEVVPPILKRDVDKISLTFTFAWG